MHCMYLGDLIVSKTGKSLSKVLKTKLNSMDYEKSDRFVVVMKPAKADGAKGSA